jgi:hypothetical protein
MRNAVRLARGETRNDLLIDGQFTAERVYQTICDRVRARARARVLEPKSD